MNDWEDARPARTPGMSAKEEILARVRSALAAPRRDEVTDAADVPRDYQRADDKQEVSTDPAKVRDVLVDRLVDYTAIVHRTTAAQLPAAIAEALGESRTVVVPAGVPQEWTSASSADVTVDDGTATPRELDAIDAVLTGCHTAIALTGTIVLRGDELGGRRAVSLVPDRHVVVVQADQVVLGVPKGIARMNEDPTAAWTMISGPSATSDIELSRVEGVHGPRRLEVVLVEPEPEAPAAEGSAAEESADGSSETSAAVTA
ncbi:LutC/YkgG family protein [Brachybacterium aquaticum]|uniref:L-lactate dehydrogenase complex protein LldG n=1 Tax=Brachybacterium aquaticum TaxID=1432564 RepID=A0A841AEP4_9MICO|nr:LUD domain-containing protein [Brachybacterium aquaticum]MBB5831740.1 L-lactate dehydrogenase complex protein LldG [Brachybacterium aquaticum]